MNAAPEYHKLDAMMKGSKEAYNIEAAFRFNGLVKPKDPNVEINKQNGIKIDQIVDALGKAMVLTVK